MGESGQVEKEGQWKKEGKVMQKGCLSGGIKRKRDNNKVAFTRLLRAVPYPIIISFDMLLELILYELFNCN